MGKDKVKKNKLEPLTTSEIMRRVKGKNTKPEITFRKLLWNNGVRGYRLHWSKVPGKPDIAFPGKKIAVFVHGCFWHRCPDCKRPIPKKNYEFWKKKFDRNKERDAQVLKELHEFGWTAMVVWECQIKNCPDELVKTVKVTLSKNLVN